MQTFISHGLVLCRPRILSQFRKDLIHQHRSLHCRWPVRGYLTMSPSNSRHSPRHPNPFQVGPKITPIQQLIHIGSQPRHMSTDEKQLNELIDLVEATAFKLFSVNLDPESKLMLSALFMQLTEGPCKEPKPLAGTKEELMFWEDWKQLGEMPREAAAKKYIELAEKLVRESIKSE